MVCMENHTQTDTDINIKVNRYGRGIGGDVTKQRSGQDGNAFLGRPFFPAAAEVSHILVPGGYRGIAGFLTAHAAEAIEDDVVA